MNAYSLGITGSLVALILLIIGAAVFAVLMYRYTVPPVSKPKRITLAVLRSLVLSLLIFILFEPVFTRTTGKVAKPKIALFVDNSQSMGLHDASIDRKTALRNVLEKSGLLNDRSLFSGTYLFDRDIFEVINLHADSVHLDGMLTDLSKPVRRLIPDDEKNIRAGILITDGAFNTGNNPLYDVGVLNKPLYIIGIGDSSDVRDAAVQSVITNELAYVGDNVPVTVNVKTSGFQSGSADVKLFEDGREIGAKQISISSDGQAFSLNYNYVPRQEGDRKLTARISAIKGEITERNNSSSEYIKILKNKRKYVILAGSSQPDVSFIRTILSQEKNVEVKAYIQKKGAEFYGETPGANTLHDAEMFFLVGFPNAYTPDGLITELKNELAAGKPVFFISGNGLNLKKLAPLEEFLPFKTASGNTGSEYTASANFLETAAANPILRTSGTETNLDGWNKLPPLFRFEHYVKVKPESERLANMKMNNSAMNEPMILSRVFESQKSIAVLASGLYRWKLMSFGEEESRGQNAATDYYTAFIQNSLRWLAAERNNRLVTIKTTKKSYVTGETVGFTAQVYDASYNPVEDAEVEVEFSSAGGKKRSVILASVGNGRYYADVEGVPGGDYSFSGSAKSGSRLLGKDSGRFSVGEISPEFINLSMNSGLLRQMAEESGGKFYTAKNCSSIIKDILKDKKFAERSVTIHDELELWSLAGMLIAVILLLTAEWIIRKREGMI